MGGMTDPYLPSAILDPKLKDRIEARVFVDHRFRYPVRMNPQRVEMMDDRDPIPHSEMTYKYAHQIITNDLGIYYLNRLQQYHDGFSGVQQLTISQHIQAMIETYPILKEKWDEFYALLVLCDGHEEERSGKFAL